MTAAGSSATDTLHSLYDRTSYALGIKNSPRPSAEHPESRRSNEALAPPLSGPGNHPSNEAAWRRPSSRNTDHDHSEYKSSTTVDEDTDTHIDEPGVSAGRVTNRERSHKYGDALDRALGDDGPTGERKGAPIDRELQHDAKANQHLQQIPQHPAVQETTAAAIAGADIGEPIQSDRNRSEFRKKIAKRKTEKEKSEDATKHDIDGDHADSILDEEGAEETQLNVAQQHPNQKGPMWASRPDDAQREKLRKQAAERQAEYEKNRLHLSKKAWSKVRGTPRPSSDGTQPSKEPGTPEQDASERDDGTRSKARFGAFLGPGGNLRSSLRSSPQDEPSEKEATPQQQQEGAVPSQAGTSGIPGTPNAKMQKISKLMLAGPGSRRNSQIPRAESGVLSAGGVDGENSPESGLDGVKKSTEQPSGAARWNLLRQKVKENQKKSKSTPKSRVIGQMSVVTELQTGILPVLMLKMAMERDEQGHRRIPVFLSHLRLRISDSVNPLHTSSAIFRIELEYGDGLIRWVCYRSLRDFINLHTHYRAAAFKGYLGRPIGAGEGDVGIPSFPKTSLPYLNQLQRQGWGRQGENVRAQFAKSQREALEDYLVELIRKTLFRPEANRLCKFFEMSALSVSLAVRGGYQGKQGYLRILSRSSRKDNHRGYFGPLQWAQNHAPKWFLVRESYICIVEQPDSLQVFDVFLIDNSFEIIRPKRLYKQTMNFAHEIGHDKDDKGTKASPTKEKQAEKGDTEAAKAMGVSEAVNTKDTTALLTEGQWKGGDDDEHSGTMRKKDQANVSSHTFYIKNTERKLKLVANNERQMNQFIASMERVARRTIFGKSNRFGSFAPIRLNCNAQWLVDGRDYFWQVSRALLRAKDRIFIHDWWLSPELYLRRPGIPKYRLDNILKKKAEEGVKIFVIVYNEVSNNFTPTDSNYTKQRLIGLHRNIYVQRSPSHFQTGTFYWAHHEKMCVIDETIAFMGGLDLCFGRWDTAEHLLTDNNEHHPTHGIDTVSRSQAPSHDANLLGPGVQGREFFVWPGQDFANERVVEWYDLTKPDVDLFDREHYPRMPWHDVALQIIGQPARDLCRHFTQRWNYLLRIKSHKRLMPFLIPPPDFVPSELQKYDLTGTCEAQICRSAGPWSLGTSNTVEHSIQNAYLKAIQMSEHFVYIENQFFVTATETRGTVIENSIGDALVQRIIRAHRNGTKWHAVIVIPLIPGFPLPIDHADASSVRLIVELQSRSICRGEHSIFGKLRSRGIDPAEYITFFSLRQWGKLPSGKLTTEQVYIHGKAMVVDDRLALIGSANINERSQRGDRDSELACVVRDTDLIDSRMAGKPFKVGRFAHTLRVRLMREHLGVDVDEIEQQAHSMQDVRPEKMLDEDDYWDPAHEQSHRDENRSLGQTHVSTRRQANNLARTVKDTAVPISTGAKEEAKDGVSNTIERVKSNGSVDSGEQHAHLKGEEVAEPLADRLQHISSHTEARELSGLQDPAASANVPASGAIIPTAEERHMAEELSKTGTGRHSTQNSMSAPDVKKNMMTRMSINPWAPPANAPTIDADMFEDPLDDRFFRDMWMASAVHNTQIFRKVFKSVPDDTVTTWSEYKAFQAWGERLARSEPTPQSQHRTQNASQNADATADEQAATSLMNRTDGGVDLNAAAGANPSAEHAAKHSTGVPGSSTNNGPHQPQQQALPHSLASVNASRPKAAAHDDGFSARELEQMESLLEETRGTLVLHSTRFLEAEDRSDNFLFPMDKINPLK